MQGGKKSFTYYPPKWVVFCRGDPRLLQGRKERRKKITRTLSKKKKESNVFSASPISKGILFSTQKLPQQPQYLNIASAKNLLHQSPVHALSSRHYTSPFFVSEKCYSQISWTRWCAAPHYTLSSIVDSVLSTWKTCMVK